MKLGPEPPDHAIGRSRGGLTSKLHMATDGKGRMLSAVLTAGNINDTTMMAATLEQIRVPRRGRGRPRIRPDRVLAAIRQDRTQLHGRRSARCLTRLAKSQL